MKWMMSFVLILGLLVAGAAWLEQVRTMALSVTIASGISDLRQENNAAQCQRVEDQTNRLLRRIRDAFVPLMWLGLAAAAVGGVGIVIVSRKRQDARGQHPAAPLSEPAARPPQG